MMEDRLFESKGRVAVHMASRKVSVSPGSSVSVPLVLLNGGEEADFFKLSVQGIPSSWVSLPSPVVRIREGEQRDVVLLIQPPDSGQVRAGRHPLVVQVASHAVPDDVVELEATLTVAALEVEGRIGLLMASNTFSAVPGESCTVPLVLLNQGQQDDTLRLAVDGIPGSWVSGAQDGIPLASGQEEEVSIAIRPPPETESRAGRHRFRIQAISQAAADDVAEAACVLTVATYTAFWAELDPLQAEAGDTVQISIENRGNYQQVFGLLWRSLNDGLVFESSMARDVRIPAGHTETVDLRIKPRSRPLVGGQMSYAYTVRVLSVDREVQDLWGEVIGKARFPMWLVLIVVVLVLSLACLSAFVLAGGALPPGLIPTGLAPTAATVAGGVPAPATELTAESGFGEERLSHAFEHGGLTKDCTGSRMAL